MTTPETSSSVDIISERLVGQVKWFNNKAGYGFITASSGENSGKDVFIHYSTIRVTNSQYKYLVQGEYVEFSLVKSTKGDHEFQALDVSGINGGALMCETRRNNRPPLEEGERRSYAPRSYRGRPRDGEEQGDKTRRPRPVRRARPDSNLGATQESAAASAL